MNAFDALWADMADWAVETAEDLSVQAEEDAAQCEDAWVDYVLTFKRERKLWALLNAVAESLRPVSLPAPKATVRERVARFVLRRF